MPVDASLKACATSARRGLCCRVNLRRACDQRPSLPARSGEFEAAHASFFPLVSNARPQASPAARQLPGLPCGLIPVLRWQGCRISEITRVRAAHRRVAAPTGYAGRNCPAGHRAGGASQARPGGGILDRSWWNPTRPGAKQRRPNRRNPDRSGAPTGLCPGPVRGGRRGAGHCRGPPRLPGWELRLGERPVFLSPTGCSRSPWAFLTRVLVMYRLTAWRRLRPLLCSGRLMPPGYPDLPRWFIRGNACFHGASFVTVFTALAAQRRTHDAGRIACAVPCTLPPAGLCQLRHWTSVRLACCCC